MGGPVKNKTFFNGIFEEQKQSQILAVTQTVYTQTAHQGIFRFFPGVQGSRWFTWSRPVISPNGLYEGRVDHLFNDKHRVSIVATHQAYNSSNVAFPQAYPSVPGSPDPTETTQYSVALNQHAATDAAKRNPHRRLPSAHHHHGGASNRISPVYQYSYTMTWIRGQHAFKGGAGVDAFGATPIASIGAGGVAVQNISTIAGIGQNAGTATNLLNDLRASCRSGKRCSASRWAGLHPVSCRARRGIATGCRENIPDSLKTISSSSHL